MGGYGGSSGKVKDKYYYDTGGHKVTDKNAIEVGKHYINEGKYVAFLQEKPPARRPDLIVDHKVLVEVKGISSTNPGQVSSNLKKAFLQLEAELSKYPENEQKSSKVVIISRHEDIEAGHRAVHEGYQEAKRKGYINGQVEFWYNEKIEVLK